MVSYHSVSSKTYAAGRKITCELPQLGLLFHIHRPANETTNLSPWEMQRDENEDLVEHEVIPDEGNIPVLRPLRFIPRSL